MADDERRRLRFLRNWYAAFGAAGQDGSKENLIYWPALSASSSGGINAEIVNGVLHIYGTKTAAVNGWYSATLSQYANMPLGEFPAGTYTITCKGFVGSTASDRIVFNCGYDADSGHFYSPRLSAYNTTDIPDGSPVVRTFNAARPWKAAFFIGIAVGTVTDSYVTINMVKES